MRNFVKLITMCSLLGVTMVLSLPIAGAAPAYPGEGVSCDQRFDPVYLRHEQKYKFGDDYINNSSTNSHKITSLGRDYISELMDFNWSGGTGGPTVGTGDGKGEIIYRTQDIIDAGMIIPKSSRMKIMSNNPVGRNLGGYYNVYDKPLIRDSVADIFIRYYVEAQEEVSPGNWVNLARHTECQPYIITWCGDGVKDSSVGPGETWAAESCDDGADNGKPGKCNTSCSGLLPPPTPICGNNIKEGTESCDGTDGVPTGKQCTASCTLEDKPAPPQCGSSIGTISGPISATSPNLCNIGAVTSFVSSLSGKTTSYSWSCNNTSGNQLCSAGYTDTTVTPICGNNIKEGTESCDGTDGVPTGKQCTASCTLEDKPVPICGNNIKEGTEECDMGTNNGKPGYSCNNQCLSDITTNACNQTFTGKLRVGQVANFTDRLTNNLGKEISLTRFTTIFREPYDYNRSNEKYEFEWTPWITSRSFIVPVGTINQDVIKSKSGYHVIDHPPVRSLDNLKIEYGIRYRIGSGIETLHKECVNYEITWCGDGILDADVDTDLNTAGVQGEQCDPNDLSKSATERAQCDPVSCKPKTVSSSTGTLSIKKYAKTIANGDSQTESSAVEVALGEEFNYIYTVKVKSGSVSGAIVKDKLPKFTSLVRIASTPAGWTCTPGTHNARDIVTCETTNTLANNSEHSFTLIAKLKSDTPLNQKFQNVAYVCAKNIPDGSGGTKPNPDCNKEPPVDPPETGCPPLPPSEQTDPACITPVDSSGFDLSIKKYINSDDADTAIDQARSSEFDYVFKVKNEGPSKAIGTTIVTDDLPAGIERRMGVAITENGWSCTTSTATKITCSINREVTSGAEFPEIRVPVKVTAGESTTVSNTACVKNDSEKPGLEYGKDTKNCNPAVFKTPCTSCGPEGLKCEGITSNISPEDSNKNTVTCRGNYFSKSFAIDQDGDGRIDQIVNNSPLNIANFTVNRSIGRRDYKCIVSSAPAFPMSIGQSYSAEWSKYSSFIDTNDNSCRIKDSSPPPPPFCGNGVRDVGEQCDGGSAADWGACGRPGTYGQCKIGGDTVTPICGDGILSSNEECDPSVYANDPEKWKYCGTPGSSPITVRIERYYDPCTGTVAPRTVQHPGACERGENADIATRPGTCNLPSVTINPAENLTKEYSIFNGKNVFGSPYQLIVGQNSPIFRSGDKLNIRATDKILLSNTDKVVIRSNGDFITTKTLVTSVTGTEGTNYRCIGGENVDGTDAGYLNDFNSYWDVSSSKRIACKPWNFKEFTSSEFSSKSASRFPFDKDRWNNIGSLNFADTNNPKNYIYNDAPDFYVTLLHGSDLDSVVRLPGTIPVRVTKPILANNAGGAGYFAAPPPGVDDGFVSLEEIAAGFLDQLKRANFNTGKSVGNTPTSTSAAFDLSKVVPTGAGDLSGGATSAKLTDTTTQIVRNDSDVTIWATTINSKKTIVVDGTLTISGDIVTGNHSVAFIADKIVIASNVTRLDGIYIANKISGGFGGSQLIVNGSLYGDAKELIANRTYARGNSASAGIVTGILVNYSSRVLSDPPPLVSDFLRQYSLTKVTSVQ